MFRLIYRIFRGIILLPVAVVLMTLLNNYEVSETKYIDTQTTMEARKGL